MVACVTMNAQRRQGASQFYHNARQAGLRHGSGQADAMSGSHKRAGNDSDQGTGQRFLPRTESLPPASLASVTAWGSLSSTNRSKLLVDHLCHRLMFTLSSGCRPANMIGGCQGLEVVGGPDRRRWMSNCLLAKSVYDTAFSDGDPGLWYCCLYKLA
jgi:hypothetical protein